MKNIFIFAPQFYPINGGYANAITSFSKELSKNSLVNKIIIFTPTQKDNHVKEVNFGKNKIKIIRVSFVRGRMKSIISPIFWYFKIVKILQEEKIDTIFYETGEIPFLGYLLVKSRIINNNKINFILRVHAAGDTENYIYSLSIYEKTNSFFARFFYRNCKVISATNEYHLNFIKKFFFNNNPWEIGEKSWFVLPNIVNNQNIDPNNNQKNKFVFKNFSNYDKIFISLGRLDNAGFLAKGFMDIVRSFSLIKIKNPEVLEKKSCIFILIGSGSQKYFLEQEVARLGLVKYFLFFEKISNEEVQELQKKASATILFSRIEGMSMFGLEALSNGSPLVLSKVGGLQDLLIDGINGYFVDSQNIYDMKEKIIKMITIEDNELEKMRQESLKIFAEKFESKKTIDKFIDICYLTEAK